MAPSTSNLSLKFSVKNYYRIKKSFFILQYFFILGLEIVVIDRELRQRGCLHPPGGKVDQQVMVQDDRADASEPGWEIAVSAAELVVAEIEVLQPRQAKNCDRHSREIVVAHVQRH